MDSDTGRARFLTAVSHDMRQPLQALLLYQDALERRVQDVEAREILAKATRAAHSLASMLDGLVLLARLDAGKLRPEFRRASVQALFDAVGRAGVRVSATSLHVRTDPTLFELSLRQLIDNALKHGGGAELSAREHNGVVEIAVKDFGAGIAPEDYARIFEEFVRLQGSPSDGLGLGLTIAQRLAKLLGHDIRVESAPGAGSTFTICAALA